MIQDQIEKNSAYGDWFEGNEEIFNSLLELEDEWLANVRDQHHIYQADEKSVEGKKVLEKSFPSISYNFDDKLFLKRSLGLIFIPVLLVGMPVFVFATKPNLQTDAIVIFGILMSLGVVFVIYLLLLFKNYSGTKLWIEHDQIYLESWKSKIRFEEITEIKAFAYKGAKYLSIERTSQNPVWPITLFPKQKNIRIVLSYFANDPTEIEDKIFQYFSRKKNS